MNADAEQTALRLSYLAQLGGGWTARLTGGDNAINIGVPGDLFRDDAVRPPNHCPDGMPRLISFAQRRKQYDRRGRSPESPRKLPFHDVLADIVAFPAVPLGPGQDETVTYDGRTPGVVTLCDERHDRRCRRWDRPCPRNGPAHVPAVGTIPTEYHRRRIASRSVRARGLQREQQRSLYRRPCGARRRCAARQSVATPSFGTRIGLGVANVTANVSESFRVPTLIDLYFPGFSKTRICCRRNSRTTTRPSRFRMLRAAFRSGTSAATART